VKKGISGVAYDINKQTIYTAPKSKIESRVHYAPEPARGSSNNNLTYNVYTVDEVSNCRCGDI